MNVAPTTAPRAHRAAKNRNPAVASPEGDQLRDRRAPRSGRRAAPPSAGLRARGRARPPRTSASPRGRWPSSRSRPAAPASASSATSERKSGAYAAPTRNAERAEAEREPDPLAEAVGGDPPGQHRHERADPLCPEHDADLTQREVVLFAQRRDEDRKPDRERRERRLRERARGENGPAVAHARVRRGWRAHRRGTSCRLRRPSAGIYPATASAVTSDGSVTGPPARFARSAKVTPPRSVIVASRTSSTPRGACTRRSWGTARGCGVWRS